MNGPVLIFGGAGFIGSNVAHRLLSSGTPVTIFDDLSRAGVERNLHWLSRQHGSLLTFQLGDVCDSTVVRRSVRKARSVFLFAGQTAVTTSLVNPIHDFEVNARGTLNVLEELRLAETGAPLLFTSTNKVYGNLCDLQLQRKGMRYEPADEHTQMNGIGENCPLSFHSPYGCSKGTADQYVLDYSRTFGIPAVVFRMSCIYGPHQCGTEDQGWVAHFLIQTLNELRITLYGDGMQVRDVLFVDDLVDAMLAAIRNADVLGGEAFNIGGGPENTVSLLELLRLIGEIHGAKPDVTFNDWRVGDQRYYVSDTRKFQAATGWRPKVSVREGVERLYSWLANQSDLVKARAVVHSEVA
jgi:CDP-paratose 2-epimerase